MMKLLTLISLLATLSSSTPGTRLIQDQGSPAYCLFAVNAYLANVDMWATAAEYQRRGLPTFDDGLTPYNENVLALLTELHGTRFTVADQWDSDAIKTAVQRGPVAVTGQGHALIIIAWNDAGRITYLDSLHAEAPRQMQDSVFWQWRDGWAWWTE